MKKGIVACLLSAAMVVTMLPVSPASAAPEDSEDSQGQVSVLAEDEDLGNNIALQATADASYTNSYGISTASMNDGELATSDPYTSWNSWGSAEYPVTTSLKWNTDQVISACVSSGGRTTRS